MTDVRDIVAETRAIIEPGGYTVPSGRVIAARRLVEAEGVERVAALNFASPKNPGGWWLGGADVAVRIARSRFRSHRLGRPR